MMKLKRKVCPACSRRFTPWRDSVFCCGTEPFLLPDFAHALKQIGSDLREELTSEHVVVRGGPEGDPVLGRRNLTRLELLSADLTGIAANTLTIDGTLFKYVQVDVPLCGRRAILNVPWRNNYGATTDLDLARKNGRATMIDRVRRRVWMEDEDEAHQAEYHKGHIRRGVWECLSRIARVSALIERAIIDSVAVRSGRPLFQYDPLKAELN